MTFDFVICRHDHDRRVVALDRPPYMSEEGMVMIDRRGQRDRRAAQISSVNVAADAMAVDRNRDRRSV